jgi:hypothetical protein
MGMQFFKRLLGIMVKMLWIALIEICRFSMTTQL